PVSWLTRAFIAFYACSFSVHDTAPTAIYTLSLHDALPIYLRHGVEVGHIRQLETVAEHRGERHRVGNRAHIEAAIQESVSAPSGDRKSTRLNSSHVKISYAVFCLKKKKTHNGVRSLNRVVG